MTRIGFITCDCLLDDSKSAKNPLFTHDDQLAVDLLANRGHQVVPVVWNGNDNSWRDCALLALRSPWDYMAHRQEFFAWLQRLAASGLPVVNPLSTVNWNIDKHYLRDLEQQGVTIPQTTYVHAPEVLDLSIWMRDHNYLEIVVKPVVSAGAFRTFRLDREAAARFQSEFARLIGECDFLVQPFIQEVLAQGEWSFLYFQGHYSHAVRKRAKPGDFRVQDDYGGSVHYEDPPHGLREQAERVIAALAALGKKHIYARVDGIDVGGRFTLIELELIEPELFLRAHPEAPRLFVRALEDCLP